MGAAILLPSPVRAGRRRHAIAALLLLVAAASSAVRIQDVAGSAFFPALDPPSIERQATALSSSLEPLVGKNSTIAISPRTPLSFAPLGLRPDRVKVIDGALRPERLEEISLLVVSKSDVYFDDALYADLARRRLPHRERMEAARSLVLGMLAGEHSAFRKCGETPVTYIFCKSTIYQH
jgi:hypothetical protein